MLKAGKVTSILGIIFGAFWIFWVVVVILLFSAGVLALPFMFM